MTSSELIAVSVNIGAALLENGAEIYRVEESISRICLAYGATEANVYAVPTAIITSFVRDGAQPVTRVRRIHHRGTNLGKLDQLNSLCREICSSPMDYQKIDSRIAEIAGSCTFPNHHLCLATGGIGFFFTLLFHGSFPEAVSAFGICIILWLIYSGMQCLRFNGLFIHIISAAWVSLAAVCCYRLRFIPTYSNVIIGSIMFLVPGLPITNAIRDLVAGDVMAGISKFTEALLVAAGIAVGVALPLSILTLLGGLYG